MKFIDKKKLIDLGFKENQAITIIRMAKHNLANNGYAYYNNKRLGVVPSFAIEEILGFSFSDEQKEE
ncbi:MAG: DUF3173 family protein [Anaerococcus hydrogenalis]|uniref:DUF3173 family protein n=1 Tax=Anaerococcus hydrogenalis TaxID=33029 RepID=UPI0028FFE931|nr:DUF3173 family protein [Anaerococcus hydrogenalis]MDU2583221.1 DUF3173 family protein [Anaerococcus hydrogenalis]